MLVDLIKGTLRRSKGIAVVTSSWETRPHSQVKGHADSYEDKNKLSRLSDTRNTPLGHLYINICLEIRVWEV